MLNLQMTQPREYFQRANKRQLQQEQDHRLHSS
ncbi:hypothetical protein ADIAG_01675 [Paeniglutamicibacter gangotriensis Lz1y]|uniref:Uncharacterized protein n=1 Tax=Paeniglutamicibacter gangotriensis Lz1y TaxID=1276920 RepID=M7MV49_9MICC|nr:hypothetical protein ADIAG_01675 [Paeniglutamicibacter gangotriensis Lz1y]